MLYEIFRIHMCRIPGKKTKSEMQRNYLPSHFISFPSLSYLIHFFYKPVGDFLPQGKVEYKARPFLATLYSMRYINLHTRAVIAVPTSSEWCGGMTGPD